MNGSRFVIQEHWARTHHYDFRLERDGVFKSWVLRKAFPQVPGVRRLAIQVEDHAISFGDSRGRSPRASMQPERSLFGTKAIMWQVVGTRPESLFGCMATS